MTRKVKIYGAGSIGNHLAQASRRRGWSVVIVDPDPAALVRMREKIYPQRYGSWDEHIKLVSPDQEPHGGFDAIFIGTPPDVRPRVLEKVIAEKPRLIQLEKPLCAPDDASLRTITNLSSKVPFVVVGYDHAVSESVAFIIKLLAEHASEFGTAETLDVECREHWEGILKAHPWIAHPEDSYIADWRRGGGALSEHSHALHLWQQLARASGLGQWHQTSSYLEIKKHNRGEYDAIAAINIKTKNGKLGRVVQDFITRPTRKSANIQFKNGYIEWISGASQGDVVRWQRPNQEIQEKIFSKKRPDDFYREILEIEGILNGSVNFDNSPINIRTGIDVMKVVILTHQNRKLSISAS